MISEHPLLTYIEDPFIVSDLSVYKKFQAKLAESQPNVQIGMTSKMFEDDVEKIRDMCTFVNPDD